MHRIETSAMLLVATLFYGSASAQPTSGTWKRLSDDNPIMDGTVYSIVTDDSGRVFAGGGFEHAGGVIANGIAMWNGATWVSLGDGLHTPVKPGVVYSMASSGDDLYVGGVFVRAGGIEAAGIARWDGSQWHSLGEGLGPSAAQVKVLAILSDGQGGIFVGGDFYSAGGQSASNIAHWDGSAWHSLGRGVSGEFIYDAFVDDVYALARDSSGNLYAGGSFTIAGDTPASHIAAWNGAEWGELAGGIDFAVSALEHSGTSLFAAGHFTEAGGIPVRNIARWDGSEWNPVGSGLCGRCHALHLIDGKLFAGAFSDCTDPETAQRSGSFWDGEAWHPLGGGLTGTIYSLASYGSSVYVGSTELYSTPSGVDGSGVAIWTDTSLDRDADAHRPEPIGALIDTLYPNPFQQDVTLYLSLKNTARVDIMLADMTGRTLMLARDRRLPPGRSQLSFGVSNRFAPGPYVVSVVASTNQRSVLGSVIAFKQ